MDGRRWSKWEKTMAGDVTRLALLTTCRDALLRQGTMHGLLMNIPNPAHLQMDVQ